MDELEDLADFPYSGERRPFDWFQSEEKLETLPTNYLVATNTLDAEADLKLCMYLYLMHRRQWYINYMAGAKTLFSIFFPPNHCLATPCPMWDASRTKELSFIPFYDPAHDWNPHYEIQRLWIHTKIHWSWLEWAWAECEDELFEDGQDWMIAKTERARKRNGHFACY